MNAAIMHFNPNKFIEKEKFKLKKVELPHFDINKMLTKPKNLHIGYAQSLNTKRNMSFKVEDTKNYSKVKSKEPFSLTTIHPNKQQIKPSRSSSHQVK